jgi:mono/diheme cytochrome c family protein
MTLLHKRGRGLLAGLSVLGAAAVLTVAVAGAQNLDHGKPPPKLFADSCAACHRSARGLAKGRFSFTLYLFLKQHYTSGSEQAWALASYLESVDAGSRRPSGTAAKSPRPAGRASQSSVRPPAPVPAR